MTATKAIVGAIMEINRAEEVATVMSALMIRADDETTTLDVRRADMVMVKGIGSEKGTEIERDTTDMAKETATELVPVPDAQLLPAPPGVAPVHVRAPGPNPHLRPSPTLEILVY